MNMYIRSRLAGGPLWRSPACLAILGLFLSLGLFSAPVQAQSKVSAKARLSTGLIKLGERASLTISVENDASAKILSLPDVKGFRFGPPSPGMRSSFSQFRSGTTVTTSSVTWEVPILVEEVGEFDVPPVILEIGGKAFDLAVTPDSFKVVTDVQAASLGHFAIPDRPVRVYEGQPFELDLRLGWSKSLNVSRASLSLPWWQSQSGVLDVRGPGFQRNAQQPIRMLVNQRYELDFERLPEEIIGGDAFVMFSHKMTKVATRSGTLEFPTSTFLFAELVENSGSQFRRGRLREYYATMAPFVIEVLPVPEETWEGPRPLDWSGAVGELKVDRRLSSQNVRAGEAIQLELTWTGMANTEFFDVPDLKRLHAFSEFRVLGAEDSHLGMERRVVYELVPMTEEITEVPSVPLWVFNPKSELFEKIESDPMPIRVAAANELDLSGVFGEDDSVSEKRDLRDIHPMAVVASGGPASGGLAGKWIALLGALVLGGWLLLRKAVRRHGDPGSARARARRRARQQLSKDLAKAGDAGAKSRAAQRFLGVRSGEPSEAWIGRDVRAWAETRQAGGSKESFVQELHTIMQRLEGALFAGVESTGSGSTATGSAAAGSALPADNEITQTVTRFSKEASAKEWI